MKKLRYFLATFLLFILFGVPILLSALETFELTKEGSFFLKVAIVLNSCGHHTSLILESVGFTVIIILIACLFLFNYIKKFIDQAARSLELAKRVDELESEMIKLWDDLEPLQTLRKENLTDRMLQVEKNCEAIKTAFVANQQEEELVGKLLET